MRNKIAFFEHKEKYSPSPPCVKKKLAQWRPPETPSRVENPLAMMGQRKGREYMDMPSPGMIRNAGSQLDHA